MGRLGKRELEKRRGQMGWGEQAGRHISTFISTLLGLFRGSAKLPILWKARDKPHNLSPTPTPFSQLLQTVNLICQRLRPSVYRFCKTARLTGKRFVLFFPGEMAGYKSL